MKLLNLTQKMMDAFFASYPRPRPSTDLLHKARLVAHRGDCRSSAVSENTVDAFEPASQSGVWGLEFDVRFTLDDEPIIHHDLNCQRVFGSPENVEDIDWVTLKKRHRKIPHLTEVLQKYASRHHLMIEVKDRSTGLEPEHVQILKEHLKDLAPKKDYHLISLSPAVLQTLTPAFPASALIGIATTNMQRMSDLAIQHSWGGVAGHYFLLNQHYVEKHHAHNQTVGVGFVESKNLLYRELARNVDWISTNSAVRMQKCLHTALLNQ